jgi:hypothetical protein
MDTVRKFLMCCLLASFWPAVGLASGSLPDTSSHPLLPESRQIGQAAFTRFGFDIYEARLWAPDGQYRPNAPFLLSLTYARDIARDRIVQASLDEMQKLGSPLDMEPSWRAELERVVLDVKKGDTLTAVYHPGQGAVFFHDKVQTGVMSDPLAKFFFAIWLDERTSEPALRLSLLGLKK